MQTEKPFTQEVHFDNGTRQTIYKVVHIEQGNWWHIFTEDGRYYIVNPAHILFVRVYGKLTGPASEKVKNENSV